MAFDKWLGDKTNDRSINLWLYCLCSLHSRTFQNKIWWGNIQYIYWFTRNNMYFTCTLRCIAHVPCNVFYVALAIFGFGNVKLKKNCNSFLRNWHFSNLNTISTMTVEISSIHSCQTVSLFISCNNSAPPPIYNLWQFDIFCKTENRK